MMMKVAHSSLEHVMGLRRALDIIFIAVSVFEHLGATHAFSFLGIMNSIRICDRILVYKGDALLAAPLVTASGFRKPDGGYSGT
jgi:hypothetical protein